MAIFPTDRLSKSALFLTSYLIFGSVVDSPIVRAQETVTSERTQTGPPSPAQPNPSGHESRRNHR
jgi:hypothetical protein